MKADNNIIVIVVSLVLSIGAAAVFFFALKEDPVRPVPPEAIAVAEVPLPQGVVSVGTSLPASTGQSLFGGAGGGGGAVGDFGADAPIMGGPGAPGGMGAAAPAAAGAGGGGMTAAAPAAMAPGR